MRPASLITCVALLGAGCAGGFGGYGPGMTNEYRTNVGCTPDAPGSSWGTCSSRSYDSGNTTYGVQLGARVGAVSASAGSLRSGTALATDAHTDFVIAREKWGVGIEAGLSSDRLFGDTQDQQFFYWGIPVSAYGQYALARKLFVHAGVGRVFHGVLRRGDDVQETVDASALRGFAGITYVFSRSDRNDFALRLELRTQRSASVMFGGEDATWSSTGVLGEIVWATF